MSFLFRVIFVIVLLTVSGGELPAAAQEESTPGLPPSDSSDTEVGPTDPVLAAMIREAERAMTTLAGGDSPPYFLALEVTETQRVHIVGEEGGLQGYAPVRSRHLDVDVRIGSARLDSTHALRSGRFEKSDRKGRILPLTDDPLLLRQGIWREIDRRFREAKERWAEVESDRQVLVDEEPADDLSPAAPVRAILPTAVLDLDMDAWEETIRSASQVLAASSVVHDGSIQVSGVAETRWFLNSEGTQIRHSGSRYRAAVFVDTVAEDGANLQLSRHWEAGAAEGLPDRDTLIGNARELERQLAALREAPAEEPYTGPAILSGRASAVFFHEILGHRLEGHRLKRVENAQTLRNMVSESILPSFISLYDDPTLDHYAGEYLFGHYLFDNQGVPSERVTLVQDGILKGFLQSRSPVREGEHSNGHGRRQAGYDAVSRQGNLLVTASESVSDEELRRELVELAKAEGLPFGLLIEEIQGGFTFTGRHIPNAFSVKVVLCRRIFVDGRPDELIREVDLIGTPLVTLSRIVRAGELHKVFNGRCGAESGRVPVSAISPALLVSQVETQRKAKDQVTPPLLPPPGSGGGS